MPGVCRTVVALVAIASVAAAQPTPDPFGNESKASGATTTIPVESPASTEILDAERAGVSSPPPPAPVDQPIDPHTYICGPGDVFELNFWGQQNFRLRIAADLEGRTFISKVGYVQVAGKSLETVRSDVRKKVRGTYPGLQFDLTLATPRTFVVHVAENVRHPGALTATPLERVSSVIARAGGSTGSRRRISVRHRTGEPATADLVMYELTGDTTYNPLLIDGDVIDVGPVQEAVTIDGAVRRPGGYELVAAKDLRELIQLAGGFAGSAARSLPIRIVHHDQNQRAVTQLVEVPADGSVPTIALADGDHVTVRDIAELQRSVMLIGAVVAADPVDSATTIKRLPYVEGDTVLSLIDRAGGLTAPGDLKRAYISRPAKNGPPQLISIDLEALLVRRDFSADKAIAMNDTIVVPPMQYGVFVQGAVSRAGVYNYNPLFGISEYIARAGGRTRSARDLDDVQLIDTNGITHKYRNGMKPLPGDSILVPERNFTRPEMVQIAIAAAGLVLSGVAITLAVTR